MTTTWTVSEVCAAVAGALDEAFPEEIWLRGEIHGARRSPAGHLYFDLTDPSGDGPAPRGRGPGAGPKMSVVAFKGRLRGIEAVLAKAGGLKLEDGLEVRIRGEISYYAPQGRVQIVMTAIDPRFTLGLLAADRERVLRTLAGEGLLELNAHRPLAPVPLRVGLVTSDGSAACADFLDELRRSGYGFRVRLADARVQGEGSVTSLVAALDHLSGFSLDVVAVIRGGGARTDLLSFDHESVARAVARFPVPVLAGIGHEIDRSIVDEVAHSSFKTPTATAAFLVDRVREFIADLDSAAAHLAVMGEHVLTRQGDVVDSMAHRLQRGTTTSLDAARLALTGIGGAITRSARNAMSRSRLQLNRTTRLTATTAGSGLDTGRVTLEGLIGRLSRAGTRSLIEADRRLDTLATVTAAADPARMLAKGYSITRGPDGSVLSDPAALSPGDRISTMLSGGTLISRVSGEGPGEPPTTGPDNRLNTGGSERSPQRGATDDRTGQPDHQGTGDPPRPGKDTT